MAPKVDPDRRQYEVRNHLRERRRIEHELLAESRTKDEFLAMLGRELRNSLAAMAAAAQLLERTAGPDDGSVPARGVIGRQLESLPPLGPRADMCSRPTGTA